MIWLQSTITLLMLDSLKILEYISNAKSWVLIHFWGFLFFKALNLMIFILKVLAVVQFYDYILINRLQPIILLFIFESRKKLEHYYGEWLEIFMIWVAESSGVVLSSSYCALMFVTLDPIKIMGNVYLIYLELMLHPRNQSWIRTVSITYLIYENSNSLSVLISHKSCVLNPVPKSGIQIRQSRLWKRVFFGKKYLYDIPYFGLTQITRFIFDLIQYVCVWRSPHNRNKTDPYM